MSDANLVWLHQRPGTQARQPVTPRELSADAEKRLQHLQRHTLSSAAKQDTPWMKRLNYPSYMEMNNFKWNSMDLKEDCKTFIWTPIGSTKKGSSKI